MHQPPNIQIVVVSYRNNKELISFLEHLADHPSVDRLRITAVANGLATTEVEALRVASAKSMPERLTLIAGAQNPGYFGGASLGLKQTTASSQTDWVIVTNDDIRFDADFFIRLAALPRSADVGVIAPDIFVPGTGLHQNPLYAEKPSFRRLRTLLWLHRHPLIMRLFMGLREIRQLRRRRRPTTTPKESFPVYAPHGACIVFSRHYFTAGGTLDYPCFLYGEEFFVAETARRLRLAVRVEPALRVKHFEHSSTGLLVPAAMARHMHHSLSFILSEYFTRSAARSNETTTCAS